MQLCIFALIYTDFIKTDFCIFAVYQEDRGTETNLDTDFVCSVHFSIEDSSLV